MLNIEPMKIRNNQYNTKRHSNALDCSDTQKSVKMQRKQQRKNKAIVRALGA